MDLAKALLLSSAAFSLIGCADITGDDANSPPTVLVQNTTGVEKSVVNLNISANDPDDNIVEYKLEQVNGSLSTNQINGSSIAITLPEVTEVETLHFTLTVTDEEGAQAQHQFTVEVTPITTEMTLKGQVTLGRYNSTAGLNVTIDIGSQSFTTSSNELGQYQAQINLDDSNLNQLVMVSASNPLDNSLLKLVSVGQTAQTHIAAAGDDDITDETEIETLHVSNLSTGIAAAIHNLTVHDKPPSTNQELADAMTRINLEQVVDFAVVTHYLAEPLLSEDYDSYRLQGLPTNFKNTFQAITEESSYQTFVSQQLAKIDSWQISSITEQLTGFTDVTLDTDLLMSNFYMIGNSNRLTFLENGEGTWSHSDDSGKFIWHIAANQLELEFPSTVQFEYIEGNRYYRNDYFQTSTFTPIFALNDKILFHINSFSKDGYGNSEQGETWQEVVYTEQALVSPDQILLENFNHSLAIFEKNGQPIVGKTREGRFTSNLNDIKFNQISTASNGDGELVRARLDENHQMTTETLNFDWEINGKHLHINYENVSLDLTFTYFDLETREYRLNALIKNTADDESPDTTSWGRLFNKLPEGTFTFDEISSKVLTWRNQSDGNMSWYQFNPDGTAAYVYAFDENNNKLLEEWEYLSVSKGLWRIEDGKLVLLRHRANRNYSSDWTCTSDSWAPLVTDPCIAYVKRTMTKIVDHNLTAPLVKMATMSVAYEDAWLESEGFANEASLSIYSGTYISSLMMLVDQKPIEIPAELWPE